MRLETVERTLTDGRWQLVTEIDEDNYVSTVSVPSSYERTTETVRPILEAAGIKPTPPHGQPFETFVKLGGDWVEASRNGSANKEAARIAHDTAVQKHLLGLLQ